MTTNFATAGLAGLMLVAMAVSVSANAADGNCGGSITAEGRATRVGGSDDFERYNGHVPADLASRRAISAWQSYVADHCPGYSAVWRRALVKDVECDSGMGHENCTAIASPRRKLFSWLLSE